MTGLMNLGMQAAKYLMIIMMVIYTVQSYTVFRRTSVRAKQYVFLRQNVSMFLLHFLAFTVMFLKTMDLQLLIFYGAQAIYLGFTLVLFCNLYPKASRLLINNMCMLLTIGMIMITRLSYDWSIRQFKIMIAGTVLALVIPVIIRKIMVITRMAWAYTFVGIGLLALVLVAASVTNGAKLSLSIGGFSFQPSEFVKIIFVFAVAGLLTEARNFKRIVIATGLAAVHVLILVVSRDLGSALIFFITYLVMLFVSTRNPFLVLAGLLAVWRLWRPISCFPMCGSGCRCGWIPLPTMPTQAIRSASPCLPSRREDGWEPACTTGLPQPFPMWPRTVCSPPSARSWEASLPSA